jgi:hypothetical protein
VKRLQDRYVDFIKEQWLPNTIRRLRDEQRTLWEEDVRMGPVFRSGKLLCGPAGETGNEIANLADIADRVSRALKNQINSHGAEELYDSIANGEA